MRLWNSDRNFCGGRWPVMAALFMGLWLFASAANAFIVINSVLLNNSTAVTAAPGEVITARVNVSTSGSNTADDWQSTGWRIATTPPGALSCDTAPNYNSDRNNQNYDTFVTAPVAEGTYNAYFYAYNSNDCSSGASVLYTLNNAVTVVAPPVVNSINLASTNPASPGSSVSWAVTFSKNVTGVNAADFALVQAGGVSGASITAVSGSGTTWTVTANAGSGTGTLGLNLVDNDSIVDASSTPLGGSGAGNGNFTGQVYTIKQPFACTPPANAPAGLALSCVCDTFDRASLNPSTIFNSNWIVSTSDTTGILPSIVNQGYLRLTNNTSNNAKAATVPGIFPAAGNYISVEFRQYAYNGSGADGIAVTLSDYSVPAVPGAFGGSLGYAQRTGVNGFAGGWLGVALDEYGNYQNPTEGRLGGPGFIPQSVAARGSGSGANGYRWLGGTGGLNPLIDNRGSTSPSLGYNYQVIVDARNEPVSTAIAVNRDSGAGYQSLISIPNVYSAATTQGFTQDPVPANWQISFTGSTGGSTNIHEIGELKICAQYIWPPSGGTANNFNAIDEAYGVPPLAVQNYLNGHIYMKVVGQPFKLNVAALANNQIQTAYVVSGSKNVTLKLVDNSDGACVLDSSQANYCSSSCTGKTAVPNGSQTLTFTSTDKGQKQSANFTLNTAYKNLVAIISDGAATGCSTDAFSVRPTGIASVVSADATNTGTGGTPVFKAGSTPFSLTATTTGIAANPSGYNGVLKINNAAIQAVSPATVAGAVAGTFPAATPGTPSSTATGSGFTYSEVGAFQLPGYNPSTDIASVRGVFDGVATASECIAAGLTTAQCDALRASTWTGVDSVSSKGDCVLDSYANSKDVNGKYGCNFGNIALAGPFGRFIPDHFVVTAAVLSNRSDRAGGSASAFTYMDEPMAVSFTITAKNAAGGTTQNYAGTLAKLALNDAASYGFGAFNNLGDPASNVPLSNRLTGSALSGSWAAGAATVSGTLTFGRLSTSPWVDGPFDSLDIGLAPVDTDGVALLSTALNRDMDNDASHINEHQYIGSTKIRFGRLWMGNAYGNESSQLAIPYESQYWNGNAFVKNTLDTINPIALGNIGLGNYQGALNSSNLPVTALSLGAYAGGSGSIRLAPPSPGAAGSVDVVARLGGTLNTCYGWVPQYPGGSALSADYLHGKWCGGTYNKDPVARATFGIFGSSGRKGPIYLRENY